MTRSVSRSWRVVALAVLAALLLTGCGAVRAVRRTQDALAAAGIRDPHVGFDSVNGRDTVTVTYRPSSIEGIQAESLRAAEVIWRVAPVRFDQVRTIARGGPTYEYERSALALEFGPRDAELDKDPADLINVRGLVLGGVAVLLVGGLAIVLIIVLVVRSRRSRTPVMAGGWSAPPPGSGWPQAPPPGSGWPPPPPGAGWQQPPPPPSAPGDPNDPWAAPPR
jgi:hypothetical protein